MTNRDEASSVFMSIGAMHEDITKLNIIAKRELFFNRDVILIIMLL